MSVERMVKKENLEEGGATGIYSLHSGSIKVRTYCVCLHTSCHSWVVWCGSTGVVVYKLQAIPPRQHPAPRQ